MAHMGIRAGPYRALVGKPEGKQSLGRPKHRWKDNIPTIKTVFLRWILLYGERR
jgi:hypothetical protein